MAAVRQVICMLLCSTLLWACDNPASAPLDGGPGDGTSPDSPLPDAEMGDLGPDTVERFVEAGLAAGTHLRVLTANVGNLDGVWKSGCPNYYQGAQCQLKVEQVIAASLASYRPDIVVLNEVFDADYCAGKNEADLANICSGYKARTPYQQVRRLLGPGYTIVCDGIAHYDCIGARKDRFSMKECPAGNECMAAAQTPAHPKECKGKRFRYHSGPAEATPPPATWENFFTLDHVLSDFLVGTCRTLGAKSDAHRLDAPLKRMDHLAIVCDLVLP